MKLKAPTLEIPTEEPFKKKNENDENRVKGKPFTGGIQLNSALE